MSTDIDLENKIGNVNINVEGLNKVKKSNLLYIFDGIKKSNNVEDLLLRIKRCNEKIKNLNIFDEDPIVTLKNVNNNNDILVDFSFKERKNNYMIGTNINNRGEITADFEINIPYIFKTINSIELKANVSSFYTNNLSFRFISPYLYKLKDFKLIIETNLSSINNIKCSSYIIKTNSLKTYLLQNNHSFIWEINFNRILHRINPNFIPSDNILKLCDKYIKNTIKYNYKIDKLNYLNTNEHDPNVIYYTPYPVSGYYYEIGSEMSLPFCEANFFKNHFNFFCVKKIINNLYTYINISNGIKYDYNQHKPYTLNNFNFTGSIGSSLVLRGFEYNSIGKPEHCYKFHKNENNYKITYNYLGANFFTNIQLIFKYILNIQNMNPMIFFYLQLGRLSNHFYSSVNQLIKDTRISTGIGIMAYIQKNISLELFFNYPILYHITDKTKFFQVGLNFKGIL
ncbi:sorting assembly machinery 50 kDa subunit, putative [Plasmodium sp. DRC-Itaito]|nr:sorting assembly machinery 50 kDa subunit, putative [Plasmodium sp. DRC-Itaito]